MWCRSAPRPWSSRLGIAACADDIKRAGFPFLVLEEGGIAFHSFFDNVALMADVAVALLVSIAVGGVVQRAAVKRQI